MDVKNELAKKAENTGKVKLTKNMPIADMIKALEPEIARALPSVITPERFTRMALNALNNTPKLAECTQMSFLGALMNAAQLGLEPNTPLGQAYLIPYKNKGVLECQFQPYIITTSGCCMLRARRAKWSSTSRTFCWSARRVPARR